MTAPSRRRDFGSGNRAGGARGAHAPDDSTSFRDRVGVKSGRFSLKKIAILVIRGASIDTFAVSTHYIPKSPMV